MEEKKFGYLNDENIDEYYFNLIIMIKLYLMLKYLGIALILIPIVLDITNLIDRRTRLIAWLVSIMLVLISGVLNRIMNTFEKRFNPTDEDIDFEEIELLKEIGVNSIRREESIKKVREKKMKPELKRKIYINTLAYKTISIFISIVIILFLNKLLCIYGINRLIRIISSIVIVITLTTTLIIYYKVLSFYKRNLVK